MTEIADQNDANFRALVGLINPFSCSQSRIFAEQIDWDTIWRLGVFHMLRPTLIEIANKLDQQTAPNSSIKAEMSRFQKVHSFTVLQSISEIIAISKAFHASQIKVMFFKGAVLGQQVFGTPYLREFNDIDLLVPLGERNEATDVVMSRGYMPVVGNKSMRKAFFDYAGQHMFFHKDTGTVLDFHWNFAGYVPFPVDPERALNSRVMLDLGGTPVPAPCMRDLALILAGHGQKEGWAWLGWALDFAKFAASAPNFDWTEAAACARARGTLRSLLTAALLTERLFDKSVSDYLITEARGHGSIVQDVERIAKGYAALSERKLEEDLMASFRLCEKPTQSAKVWLQLLLTRTIGDYEALPLPARLWWVYHFTRPVRLLWRIIRGVRSVRSVFWETRKKDSLKS